MVLPFDFSVQPVTNSLYLFLSLGVIEVVSIFIFMKMHALTHLSISTIISRTRLIWVPVIMFFLFGQTLNNIEYVGIAVLFLGLSIAVSPHKLLLDKGIVYAYSSAFIAAVLSVAMKSASPVMSTSLILIGMSFAAVIIFPIVMKDAQKRIKAMLKKNLAIKVLASAANTMAMYLYVYALRIGDVSKVTAIYQAMMIVSIVAGIMFLGERQDAKKKLVGAAITIVGVVMLTAL